MILIKNGQRKIKIDTSELKKTAQQILDILDYADFDLNILLTTNKNIQKYNKNFRQKDKPTDILSFSYHPDLKAGQRIKPLSDEDKNLGDLIISLEYVKEDTNNWNQTFDERMKILLVHGVCHLLGYDHIADEDYEVMQKKENFILKNLK